MSILQRDIPGARVLDLYAGSGALGLEALSRGAVSADFVENNFRSLKTLEQNVEALEAAPLIRIHRTSALSFVKSVDRLGYDLAFADPPYAKGESVTLADVWLIKPFSRVLSVEHDAGQAMPGGGDTRRYGSTAITFYRTEE